MTEVFLGNVPIKPGPRRQINLSAPRAIAKIDIPGGKPQYQDMGSEESTVSWSGVFKGDGAYHQAVALEKMKEAGQIVPLQVGRFSEISGSVRIKLFDWELVRGDRVNYKIELVVVPPAPPQPRVMPVQDPAADSTPTPPAGKTYTVKQGDTLWALAAKHLGNGAKWRQIASANKITDPRKLQIGRQIIIPG